MDSTRSGNGHLGTLSVFISNHLLAIWLISLDRVFIYRRCIVCLYVTTYSTNMTPNSKTVSSLSLFFVRYSSLHYALQIKATKVTVNYTV